MNIVDRLILACANIILAVTVSVQMFFAGLGTQTTSTYLREPLPPHAMTTASSAPPIILPAITTTAQKKVAAARPKTVPAKKQSTPASLAPVAPKTLFPVVISTIPNQQRNFNADTRSALVNVLCVTGAGGYFHPISGSGIIISSQGGVILTNAHVGQYFLLRDYPTANNVECTIRIGSPAKTTYKARLLYLPPAWMDVNANQIVAQQATGTGENDYALLIITSTIDGSPLPTAFPTVPISIDASAVGDPVLLVAYPAGFLGGTNIAFNLYASSALTTIKDIFTFTANTVDLVSVSGTVVSQAGSSGGAVVRTEDGALLGILATATEGTTTASRDLRAITLAHIDRSLGTNTNTGLIGLLTGDLVKKADVFNADVAPGLTKKLTSYLTKQ